MLITGATKDDLTPIALYEDAVRRLYELDQDRATAYVFAITALIRQMDERTRRWKDWGGGRIVNEIVNAFMAANAQKNSEKCCIICDEHFYEVPPAYLTCIITHIPHTKEQACVLGGICMDCAKLSKNCALALTTPIVAHGIKLRMRS